MGNSISHTAIVEIAKDLGLTQGQVRAQLKIQSSSLHEATKALRDSSILKENKNFLIEDLTRIFLEKIAKQKNFSSITKIFLDIPSEIQDFLHQEKIVAFIRKRVQDLPPKNFAEVNGVINFIEKNLTKAHNLDFRVIEGLHIQMVKDILEEEHSIKRINHVLINSSHNKNAEEYAREKLEKRLLDELEALKGYDKKLAKQGLKEYQTYAMKFEKTKTKFFQIVCAVYGKK